MTIQEPSNLSSLTTRAVASIGEYEKAQTETARQDALENARRLVRVLEKPAEAIYKLFTSVWLVASMYVLFDTDVRRDLKPSVPMAVKIAHDMGIFALLSHTTSFVTCEELAAEKNADVQFVGRIMRVLVCNGFAHELDIGQYASTDLSRQMTDRLTIGTMDSLFIDFLPIMNKTPEYFQKTGYKSPDDPTNGPFQYVYNTTGSCWDWMAKHPDALGRFNTFMESGRDRMAHWAQWFPVQTQLLDGAVADRPLLVDVGGGRGHDILGFKELFPSTSGTLVLEDLPSVIEDIRSLDGGIRRVKHDFFKPQPVKGARAYYFKHIMHDWSDEHCRTILKHTTAAMEKGYSKVLIENYIIPDLNAGPKETLIDMVVMIWCTGVERTRRRWTELLQSAGLVVTNFWLPEGQTKGIIEAELQDTADVW